MAKTEHTDYKFTVKEGDAGKDGSPAPLFLMCEPSTPELSIVGNGFLTIRLKPGTTIDEAQGISRYLRDHVQGISYTKL